MSALADRVASAACFGQQAKASSLLLPDRTWAGGPTAAAAKALVEADPWGDALAWSRSDAPAMGGAARVAHPFQLQRSLDGPSLAAGAEAWRAEALSALLQGCEGLAASEARAIVDDALSGAAWVLALAAQLHLGASGASIRLAGEHQAPCWKFHVDAYPFRAIGTWWGPGTEWVPGWAVQRAHLGCGHEHPQVGGEDAVVPDGDRILAQGPGTLLLMPGKRWPGRGGLGAVHRSPSLRPGEDRLVVAIEPIVGR